MNRLTILKERYALYLAAEKAILEGAQSYAIGSRNLTRADLHEIRMELSNLDTEIARLSAKQKMRTVGVIPRDW